MSDIDDDTTGMRKFRVANGLPTIHECRRELDEYLAVLMGHEPPPIKNGVMTMMEVANTYLARAMQLTLLIQRAEQEGHVLRGHAFNKFRTGELRTFVELASKANDLGSRRVTAAQMEYEMKEGV